jgi:probable F420-dependent oxidoreductase
LLQIPFDLLYKTQLQHAVLAEELGYYHLWIAEHHGVDMYATSSPFAIAAAMAVLTRRIRIGTFISILPLHHPIHVAEQAATVDVLSGGRFELGVGLGNFPEEFIAFGVSRKERGSRMEDGLAILKGLWTQESFSFEGKHFNFSSFSLRPTPVQAQPPLWVAGTSEKAMDRAARFGCHLAGTGDYYERRLHAYGHDPKKFNKTMIQFMHLSQTREQAWREAGPAILRWLGFYKNEFDRQDDFAWFRKQPGGYFGVDPLPHADDLENMQRLHFLGSPFIIGTTKDAVDWVRNTQKLGVTHLVITMFFGGIDPRLTEHTMHIFAKEVIPVFHN